MAYSGHPLKLIGFQPEDFYELERESEPFSRWLDANNSPSELMAVLAPALRARPVAEPPEREVLRRILPGLRLVPAHQIRELPDDDAVWLWNSQPVSGEAVQIGEVVDPERLGTIPLGEPLRLVRIERDLWTQALEPDLQAPDEIQLPDAGVSPDDRYADLLPSLRAISKFPLRAQPWVAVSTRRGSYRHWSFGPDHVLFGDAGALLQRAISAGRDREGRQ